MSYDEYMADRVRALMPTRSDVVEMRMMGGLAFLLNGNLCCGISHRGLMVRIGPEAYLVALASPNVGVLKMGNRPAPVGYVRVEPEGIDAEEDLARWVALAVEFTGRLPVKKVKEKKVRKNTKA